MNTVYLVNDVRDATVARHVELLAWAGVVVRVAGYRRTVAPCLTVNGAPVVDLGISGPPTGTNGSSPSTTRDGAAAALAALDGATVVIARGLDSLITARRTRSSYGRLVYERLTPDRAAPRAGLSGPVFHALEREAMHDADLVMTASPGAERQLRDAGYDGPVAVLENKVLALDRTDDEWHLPPLQHETSWIIGWFGELVCTRSWDELRSIVSRGRGQIEVLVAGRADLTAAIDVGESPPTPGIRIAEPYTAADVPALHASTHFSWMIDHGADDEAAPGPLPVQLFEAIAHCSVPIALAGSPVGTWLRRMGVGLLVEQPEADVVRVLSELEDGGYESLLHALGRVPSHKYLMLSDEARALVGRIVGHG